MFTHVEVLHHHRHGDTTTTGSLTILLAVHGVPFDQLDIKVAMMRFSLRFSAVLTATAMAVMLTATAASAAYPLDGEVPETNNAAPAACGTITVSQAGLAEGMVVTFTLADSGGATTSVDATADASGAAELTTSVDTEVLGVTAVNIGATPPAEPLAITGRSFGGAVKAAVLAVAIGAVLLGLSLRRENDLVDA